MGLVHCDRSVDLLAVESQTAVKPIPWHHYAIALTRIRRLNLQQSPKFRLKGKHHLSERMTQDHNKHLIIFIDG